MSYQVLARKWRPGKFSELVGQEHVVSAISNALDNDRLHHAYLFTGTRGVGKTTIARIFSKSLNCEQGQGANPCGQCDTCKEIEHGNYVDLLEIDAASRTKVEDTRELLDNVQYRPTRGRFKVYLIDEVHMLSKHSFNALLKTLEEPPPHVKFLLATTDPQKLPITILSRCLQFNLKALSREQITGQLAHILEAESIAYEASALALLARAAQGSMRDALSLTDQAIAQGDNQVLAGIVTDMLGLMDKHQLLRLIHAVVKKEPQTAMDIVAAMAEQAPDYGQVLAELSSLLHQIALTQWIPDACKLETTSAKAVYQLAKTLPAEQVQLLYQIALQGQKDLPYAPDGRSGLEMTVLRMMSFAPSAATEGLEDILTGAPDQAQTLPVHNAQPPTASDSASPQPHGEMQQAPAPSPVPSQANDALTTGSGTVDADSDQPSQNHSSWSQREEVITTQPGQQAVVKDIPPRGQRSGSEPEQTSDTPEDEAASLAQEMASIEDQAKQLRGDSADKPISTQQPEYAQDDNGPPSFEDGPPLSAYEDMPMEEQEMSYEDTPTRAGTELPGQPVQQNAESQLSSTEEMLALRQRLKKAREESRQSGVKKPEAAAATRLPTRQPPVDANAEEKTDEPLKVTPSQTDEQHSASAQVEDDPPPWATDTTTPPPDATSASLSSTDSARNDDDVPAQQVSAQSDNERFGRDSQEEVLDAEPHAASDSPQPVTESYTGGTLTAYLDDGTKLVHASQIDSWSQLVENMPVAGLLKQLALHSAFYEKGNEITLELDDSQAHLVNEGAVAQLTSALREGLGREITLTIQMGQPESTPFQIQQRIQTMRQQHAEHVVSTDDKIQSLMNVFQATVVADSVKAR